MRSNVCKTGNIQDILTESERVAAYNGLDRKQALRLRLLCEELGGMLPVLVGDFSGEMWIDFEDGVCRVNASIEIEDMSAQRKEQLIDIAKNKKNASAVGVVGRIRATLEAVFLDNDFAGAFTMSAAGMDASIGYHMGADYSNYWSLSEYKTSLDEKSNAREWDALEKSVIASIADDVIVGVRGRRADIVVVKRFA